MEKHHPKMVYVSPIRPGNWCQASQLTGPHVSLCVGVEAPGRPSYGRPEGRGGGGHCKTNRDILQSEPVLRSPRAALLIIWPSLQHSLHCKSESSCATGNISKVNFCKYMLPLINLQTNSH